MRGLLKKFRSKTKLVGQREQVLTPPLEPSDDLGLKIIYEGPEPTIDIVAIHGDGGHYERSWTHLETGVFWLRDLLPRIIPNSRIVSFGYRASKPSPIPVEEIASNLLKELSKGREGMKDKGNPIIFLPHSFGVILLKGALTIPSPSDPNSITAATRGIIFFGSPPNIGHSLESLASLSLSNQSVIAESPAIATMKKDLRWLQDTSSEYEKLEKSGRFEIMYFLESAGESLESQETSRLGSAEGKFLRMKKTHGRMIQFPDAEDEDFRKVEKCVKDMVAKL